jgi:UDP-N-acetyl-D-glucosamine dehydrogenase
LSAVHTTVVERIRAKQAKVGIIGLGYVGLPLAVEFARAGLDVTGFDVDEAKITSINQGRTYIPMCRTPISRAS